MYDYVRDRQDRHTHVKPARSAAPTVTPAKRLIHIQRAHCATIVARAGTHTRSHNGGAHEALRSTQVCDTTHYFCGPGFPRG